MKAMLFTVYGEYPMETGFTEVETDGGIQDMYDFLGVDCIDMAVRSVGGKEYTFVVDDIGMFVDSPRPSAFRKGQPELVGNLLVFGWDGSPDMVGLDDGDTWNLVSHLAICSGTGAIERDEAWPALLLD